MEFTYSKNKIVFDRELSNLDKLVLRFVKILHKLNIRYVIISGYIAILFGRSRNTEDVDLFIEKIDEKKMKEWWNELEKEGFWGVNVSTPQEALHEYLENNTAIRFAVQEKVIPNFEVKFTKSVYNEYSLDHPIEVFLNGEKIYTSEMELQIAYKLLLGTDKDFEDARHLYRMFKPHLNVELLQKHINEIGVKDKAEKVLWH
jgi:predicted nucleotidyltransferase